MKHEVIISGLGGQGILVAGLVLANAGLRSGKKVSWLPSYGPERRGGTANCMVVISDREVQSPYVSRPDALIAMNLPSIERFGGRLKDGGLLLYDETAAPDLPIKYRERALGIPLIDLALRAGSAMAANMVALGAYICIEKPVGLEQAVSALPEALSLRSRHLIELDEMALRKGFDFALAVSFPARC